MTGLFAAVHESVADTERTSWAGLSMSVDWGRPEVAFRGGQVTSGQASNTTPIRFPFRQIIRLTTLSRFHLNH